MLKSSHYKPGSKFLLVVLTITLVALGARLFAADMAYPLNGSWSGNFMIGPEDQREIIFHIKQDNAGYAGTLDYPAMASAGVRIDRIQLDGDSISLLINAMQAEYFGSIQWSNPEKTQIERIIGDWSQAGEYVPVILSRKE